MRAISTRVFMALAGVALALGSVSVVTAPAQADSVSTLGSCTTGMTILTGWATCTGHTAHRAWVACYDDLGQGGYVPGPWQPSGYRSTVFCGLGFRAYAVYPEVQDLP